MKPLSLMLILSGFAIGAALPLVAQDRPKPDAATSSSAKARSLPNAILRRTSQSDTKTSPKANTGSTSRSQF